MRPEIVLKHEFVEYIPKTISDGTIYISIAFGTAVHKCCCGCGNEVVTPLSTTDWELNFDGHSISLYPSIGNWSFPCQSHYWIKRNRVKWAPRWSKQRIEDARRHDKLAKEKHFGPAQTPHDDSVKNNSQKPREDKSEASQGPKPKSWWA